MKIQYSQKLLSIYDQTLSVIVRKFRKLIKNPKQFFRDSKLFKYLEKNNLQIDWNAVKDSPSETLVNSLCSLSPYSAEEKQALLEADNIQKRNDLLIAMTEMALSTNKGIESIQ